MLRYTDIQREKKSLDTPGNIKRRQVCPGNTHSIPSSHFKATRAPEAHADAQRHCQVGLNLLLGEGSGVTGRFYSSTTALYNFLCCSLMSLATRPGTQSKILILFFRALCRWQIPSHAAHFYTPFSPASNLGSCK